MTFHSVHLSHLEEIRAEVQARANTILEQVDTVQGQLQATTYIGQNADQLAEEMNNKMTMFVAATHQQLDQVLRLVVDNMNVVVTKLGGQPWDYVPVQAMAIRVTANTQREFDGMSAEIDTGEMTMFADQVDAQFKGIIASYHGIQSVVSNGGGRWQGPEQMATATAMNNTVPTIVAEVANVGSSLQTRILEQSNLMAS